MFGRVRVPYIQLARFGDLTQAEAVLTGSPNVHGLGSHTMQVAATGSLQAALQTWLYIHCHLCRIGGSLNDGTAHPLSKRLPGKRGSDLTSRDRAGCSRLAQFVALLTTTNPHGSSLPTQPRRFCSSTTTIS